MLSIIKRDFGVIAFSNCAGVILKSESIVVTLSGRGDKDVEEVQKYLSKHVKN